MHSKFVRLSCPILLALVLFTCGALASIEREPVKVDKHNAGPKYDIDELERTRVLVENNNPESNQVLTAPASRQRDDSSNNNNDRDQDAPVIAIRRIFLVPVMSSPSSGEDNERPSDPMRMFGMQPPRSLFSPFSSRHLFGGDEASRPTRMNPDESQERPIMSSPSSPPSSSDNLESNERPRPNSGLFDPIEMLMEAMRQALNPANMMPQPPQPDSADLNKEASGDSGKPETGLEAADKKPQSFNSTKEDIVEIDGKKFLRKTVINRHVGDGIMFMTRRLIFSPLNETETETPASNNKDIITSSTTTATPTEPTSKVEKIDEPKTDAASTVSSETTEPAKESVAPEITPSTPSSTTVATDKEDTTTKSIGDKITETVSRVERLMEKVIERKEESGSTTEKPSS